MSLTTEQVETIEEMVSRRVANTGESRDEACDKIAAYLEEVRENKVYLYL